METSNAIEKTLQILKLLSNPPHEFTAKEISEALNITKPTVHRILNVLEKDNYISKNDMTKKYSVGYMLYTIGMQYANHRDVYSDLRGMIDELAEKTGQQVGYAILDGVTVVSIYESEFMNAKIRYLPGTTYSINSGVYGLTLLAFSDQQTQKKIFDQGFEPVNPRALTDANSIREACEKICGDGYAESRDAFIEGTIALGVPVHSVNGQLHGCIALSGIATETFENNKMDYLEEIRLSAKKITSIL